MAYCRNCGSRLKENAKFCASCGQAVTKTQQPAQPQQPIYQQPRYVPPTPVKKKSSAPLIIGGIAGLFVIAIIAVVIFTTLFGTSEENDLSGRPSQTSRPVSHEMPADGIPDGMPDYTDGEMTVESCGYVVGLYITDTNERYFYEYINSLRMNGLYIEEVSGADNMYLAGLNNRAVSLIFWDNNAFITKCPMETLTYEEAKTASNDHRKQGQ